MKFQLLRGVHQQKDENGVSHIYSPVRGNNIIESNIDLSKRFGSSKFRNISPAPENVEEEEIDDSFESMTLKELKEYAFDNEIDLEGATKKVDIIQIIEGVED